ncbi:MAG: GNAT family N-acetyltransferase [Lachnospiraceae bacterium]|nr:GNAT family N-acetyltransferase [Lachnospiraceae bacterium]
MKLKNVLIVVKDAERSRQFYHDLFGLELVLDNDGNMILTEGLVLQEEKYWKEFLGREIVTENNACELYFEETNIEGFAERLEKYYPDVKYVNRLMTHSWGQKVIRFYDPDGNLIEVGTPVPTPDPFSGSQFDDNRSGFVEETEMVFEMMPCSEDDREFIEEQAGDAFNATAQPEEDAEEEFVYVIADESGNLLGGCVLSVDGLGTASIYDLWVEEEFRGQGMASALIREAEREAREHGCYLAMVGTFDWQARPLYDKHGYMLNDTMTDVPKGHEHYMLTKRLDRAAENYIPSNTGEYEIRRGGEEDAEILSGKLREYDSAIAPREHDYIPLSKKIVDENGRIIAGFVGGVDGWNGTDIDALWVEDNYRDQGIGSGLLAELEREVKENGADVMFIEAYDWNVGFFKKNGYEKVTGLLEDYPKGHVMYCMQKSL